MKHFSHQFGDWFWGFGRQSEKFSSIGGACIRHNFMPCEHPSVENSTLWKEKVPLPKSPDRNYSYYIFQGDSDLWQSCTFILLNVLFKNLDPWGVILWRPATYLMDSRVTEIVENFCWRCTFILSLKKHIILTQLWRKSIQNTACMLTTKPPSSYCLFDCLICILLWWASRYFNTILL